MPIIKEEESFEHEEVMAEINITPLTDIFLVLLVIFMISAPLLVQSGVKVHLPSTKVVDTQSQGLIVSLSEDGKIYVGDQEVSIESLGERLSQKLRESQDKVVILQGDKNVLLGHAVRIMDISKLAGAQRIAIATQPKEETVEPEIGK